MPPDADNDFYADLLTHFHEPDLPDEVINGIKSSQILQTMDFTGQIALQDQVIKASVIRFANNAKVIISDVQHPWVAIVADEIIIEDPSSKALISRPAGPVADGDFSRQLAGSDAPDQPRAPDGKGTDGHRNGNPGAAGANGERGEDGGTQQLPLLYIMTNRVRWGKHQDSAPASAIVIMYDGIEGGDGGDGGNGGYGGNGDVGADGDSDIFNCRHGPARGGDGGAGGVGGRGGNAGKGGDGGSVVLVSPSSLISDFFLVRQEPGGQGRPGAGGVSGKGGAGARGGRPRGHCHGNGQPGSPGANQQSLGAGSRSSSGKRGIKGFVKRNIDDLL